MGLWPWYLSLFSIVILHSGAVPLPEPACTDYTSYSLERHQPLTIGKYRLPSQRPPKPCRTFTSQEVEDTIMQIQIPDPDLARLFENTFPNTLDTAVKWTGFAKPEHGGSEIGNENLAFIITGDMWDQFDFKQLCLAILTLGI